MTIEILGNVYQASAWANSNSSHINSDDFPTMMEALRDLKTRIGRKRPTTFSVRQWERYKYTDAPQIMKRTILHSGAITKKSIAELEAAILEVEK